MKKGLLVAFGLVVVVVLSACGHKTNEWSVQNLSGKSLDGFSWNALFTLDELDNLEEELFPTSYVYRTYQKVDWNVSDTWEYVYPPDYRFLLPIDEYVTDREVTSSEMANGMIYTMVDGKLGDESVSILYINDPDTLKYAFATVYRESETTLYTFSY